jgi:hypothetical protein
MNSNGENTCALNNFIKFGGAMVMHHNCHIPKGFLLVVIKTYLIKGAHFLCLKVSHDPPFRIVNETIQYVVIGVSSLRCPKNDQVLLYFCIFKIPFWIEKWTIISIHNNRH